MNKEILKEVDKRESRSARELMQIISKTARTVKIYLPNNPIYQKFLQELTEGFKRHTEEFGSLRLKIRQHEILLEDQVVYENSNRIESMAFKLFADGIRELIFNEGIEKEEIMDFLDVIGQHDPNNPDDDMVTLLWEKDLPHISYVVIEDFAGGDTFISDDIPEDENRADLKKVLNTEVGVNTTISSPYLSEIDVLKKRYTSIFTITEEEIESIKREIEKEDDSDLINEMINILYDILRIEKDFDSFSDIMDIFDKILDGLILKGDFRHAISILTFLKEFLDKDNDRSERYRQRVIQSIDRLGDTDRIKNLESTLNSSEVEDIESIFLFLTHLHKNSIIPLSDLLGEVTHMKIRRVMCDALIELGRHNIDLLMSGLTDNRWYVIRNIVYILGKIQDPKAIDGLKSLVNHKEPRLRKEVIHALEIIKDKRGYDLLVEFLNDEDSSIRVLAARVLADVRYKPALEPILRVIIQKDFNNSEIYEKREMFIALGKIGSNEIIPFLSEIIKRRRWFKKTKNEETRLCSIWALQQLKTNKALAVLKEGRDSREKMIRDACIKALEDIEREGRA